MPKLYKDFFFHFDIAVMILFFLTTCSYVFIQGGSLMAFVCFILGLLTFAFSEYTTHRFLFHMKPPKNIFFLKLIKRLHYDHHVVPNDLHLLFLPLWYSLPLFFVLMSIFYLIVSSFLLTAALGIGVMCMFLIYEWKHYIAHRPIKPVTKFGKWMKKHHILHHFKNENYWFGVSNPIFDAVFGTLKEEKDVPTSDTARNLEKNTTITDF